MKSEWMGLLLVAVICLIGEEVFAQRHRKEVRKQARKYKQVLKKIDARYADTVNFEALTDTAITKIVSTLDPHSCYMSRKDAVLAEAEDQGEYAGVGLQYSVLRDTIVVARCIVGSPAEKAGIRKRDL